MLQTEVNHFEVLTVLTEQVMIHIQIEQVKTVSHLSRCHLTETLRLKDLGKTKTQVEHKLEII